MKSSEKLSGAGQTGEGVMKIKRGDMVVIISGDQAGKAQHRVTQVIDGGRHC